MSDWSIQKLLEDEKLLKDAKEEWRKTSLSQSSLGFPNTKKDLDKKME